MCILTYRPRRKGVSNRRTEERKEAISTKKGNFTRFCGSFFLSARRNQKIRAPLHPQKRVILPVFAEVFSFSSEKPQNKTTFASTKEGNITRFCGSLLILTILQVFSSPTTDYTEERLSSRKCRTETSMRDTEFTLRDTEPSMRRFTKSGTSTNENGVFAIASL